MNFLSGIQIRIWLMVALVICTAFAPIMLFAQKAEDLTKGPFFIVKAEKETTELLPLKSTRVDIGVAGVIADITITQEYINTGNQKLEAIYIFPASTRAAVYALDMSIGDRNITAKIAEKRQAKRDYEQAKQEGRTATLLEQHRPNVFQMSVGHILPKDKIIVTLKYTELLIPEDGLYELAFPTVVGPRYADDFMNGLNDPNTWVNNPYLEEGQAPTYNYEIKTHIQAGMPIKQISSPSHQVNITYKGKEEATITLKPEETKGGTKDYIVRYRLSGTEIQSGLLLFEGEKENFFLAMVQPPQTTEKQAMPPREYIFIIDVSGSMRGFPLDISKEMMTQITGTLRPQDRFNIMLFESGNVMLSPTSVPANKANLAMAMDLLDNMQGGGGTELIPAMKVALKMPETEGYSRSFIIITDGFINVEQEVFDIIRKNLGEANFFAVGAGSSINRFLIEGIARAGQGEPLVVTDPLEAATQSRRFEKYISTPALTNIAVDFGDAEVYDVEPLSIPDVLAERPIIIYGKYKGKPTGNITLKGTTGQKDYQQQLSWGQTQAMPSNSALRYLWARNKIAMLNDYTNLSPSLETVKEITQLGLDYNLLTNYTSFIAIDAITREASGQEVSVKQVLPLPQGVQNSALNNQSLGYSSGVAGGGNIAASAPVRSAPASARPYGGLNLGIPNKQRAFTSKISIAWSEQNSPSTAEYHVTVLDLMGNILWEADTKENVVDIDLKDAKFSNITGHALLVKVENKTTRVKSEDIILELMKGAEANAFIQQASSLLLAKGVVAKLDLATYYEQMGMLANALGATREAITLGGGEVAERAYKGLLLRMGL